MNFECLLFFGAYFVYSKRLCFISQLFAKKYWTRTFRSILFRWNNDVKSKILSDIISNPVEFKPFVIKGISSKYDEYLAIISPDQELAFIQEDSLKTKQDIAETSVEEFTLSQKKDGVFSDGDAMKYPFNRTDNEGGATVTIDNNTLYYTKCRDSKGYNNCDIYYTTK